MVKDLTSGRPLRLILQFAFPLYLSLLLQQFYNLVDTMIVGRILGPEVLAAVGSTGSLNFMILGFCNGICAGFSIPMAQAFGAGREHDLKKYIGNSVWLCTVSALVLAAVTSVFCRSILKLMNTPDEILDNAHRYIRIIFMGIPASFLYNMLSCMIRAVGDSKTPVLFLGLASMLNIILDILLITGAHMGVAGAAAATVIAQSVSGILCLIYLKKKFRILQPSGEEWHLSRPHLGKLLLNGLPMGLQYSITAIGSIILQTSVNTLGTFYVATIAASVKLHMFFCCPFDALGSTMSTFAGQNIGARKISRIREALRDCMILGSIYGILAFLVYFFFGKILLTLFTDPGNVELISNGRLYLLWTSAFYILLAGVNIFRFCIQGMGYSRSAVVAGGLEMLSRAFAGLVLVPLLGFTGACLASPTAWITACSFLIPMYIHLIKKLGLIYQE